MAKDKVLSGIYGFFTFLLWFFVFGVAVRFFECAILTHYQGEFAFHLPLAMKGVFYDTLLGLRVSVVLFLVYGLLSLVAPKTTRWVFAIIGAAVLLSSMAMIMYFVSALVPLDKIIFNYSLKELFHIAGSTGSFVWWSYVCLALIPTLFVVTALRCEIKWHKAFIVVYAVLAIASLAVPWPPDWLYDDKIESYEVANKHEYFFKSLLSDDIMATDLDTLDDEAYLETIAEFQSMFPENEFVDPRYPLAHIDRSPDILSDYFDLDTTRMPNIVIVITEGLGREFSGYNSQLPSATPFLDSLAERSLTWVNCLSSSQRTVAVLPTLLGSLPMGKRGFMQSPVMPQFHSLPTLLKRNGYTTSFFYGGWTAFDNMIYFMRDMGVENYLPESSTYPETMRNTWGLLDEHTFAESFKQIDFENPKPRLDIYLTLTTHDPFDYPDKEEYTLRYRALLAQKKINIPQWIHEQYASFFYYDKCLRDFFEEYKTKPGFDNTIFIITGDHCFNNRSEELTRYHVPLVIWSPMLKEARRFTAMASHRDVTPSLLAMLKGKYHIETPETESWLNTGLDTLSTFEAKTFSPQLKITHALQNMTYNNWFYDRGKVYELTYDENRLQTKPVINDTIAKLMHNYLSIDDYVMRHNALIVPDSSKTALIFEVTDEMSVDFTTKKTGVMPKNTLGEKDVFALERDFPLSVFTHEFDGSATKYTIHCEFDVYQPEYEDEEGELHIVISVDGKNMLKDYLVNYYDYDYYDQWTHITMTQTIDTDLAGLTPGDNIRVYFRNRKERKFYLKDFKARVEVLRKP